VPDRLPLPGPSFLKERELRIGERTYRLGMARPMDGPDGWWLAILWVADDEAVIPFRDVAPAGARRPTRRWPGSAPPFPAPSPG
jgi:hypothetical protein